MAFMEPSRIEELIDRFRDQRVVVLGDLMLDQYLFGDTQRISPEAPVPVIEASAESTRLGGAANVAANVRALGGRPRLIGLIGRDAPAAEIEGLCEHAGIEHDALVRSDRRTTIKTRVLARNQQVVRIDREVVGEIEGALLDRVIDRVREELRHATACIISDYGKGVVTPPLLRVALEVARAADVPVCVDPKETHFFEYCGVDLITPNTKEASAAAGFRIQDETSLLRAGFALQEKLGCRAVLITRGELGMALFEDADRVTSLPAIAREVFDVTGAGDTVVGACAVALGAGASALEAAALANHAAGLSVREVGTAAPTAAAVREAALRDRERGMPAPLQPDVPEASR